MTGINITNKKKLAGRNIRAHIARKLSMPFPAAVDDIKDDYPDIKRSYTVRVNGKTVYEPPEIEKKKKVASGPYATNFLFGHYKDEVKKGKWV